MFVKVITTEKKCVPGDENNATWRHKNTTIYECDVFRYITDEEADDVFSITHNGKDNTIVSLQEPGLQTDIFLENNNGKTIGSY